MEDAPATSNFRAAVNCRSLVPFQNSSLSSSPSLRFSVPPAPPCPTSRAPLPPSLRPRPRFLRLSHPHARPELGATNVRSRANFRAWLACREYRHGPSEILARRGATDKLNRPLLSASGQVGTVCRNTGSCVIRISILARFHEGTK